MPNSEGKPAVKIKRGFDPFLLSDAARVLAAKGRRGLLAASAAILLGVPAVAISATAEPADIDLELAAKIAREKAKIKRDQHEAGIDSPLGGTGSSLNECGSVNIGNVNNEGNRIGAVPRNNTVVITGPVINVGNKCK